MQQHELAFSHRLSHRLLDGYRRILRRREHLERAQFATLNPYTISERAARIHRYPNRLSLQSTGLFHIGAHRFNPSACTTPSSTTGVPLSRCTTPKLPR